MTTGRRVASLEETGAGRGSKDGATMSDIDTLMNQIPIGDIAKQFGVSEDDAEAAVRSALPGLLGGMAANAVDTEGAVSLEKALGQHAGQATPARAADVDVADGERIVGHVLGDKTDRVASGLADANPSANVTGDLIKKVLPIVAPIVLAWLANKFLGGGSGGGSAGAAKKADGGGGIGDLLGGILGGMTGSGSGGGDLGGLLGGLFGGR